MRQLFLIVLIAWLSGCAFPKPSFEPAITLSVAAGAYDRQGTLVVFKVPEAVRERAIELVGPGGTRTPVQVDAQGQGTFILDRLPKGQTATFRVAPAIRYADAIVVAERDGDRGVRITAEGRPMITYNFRETPLPRPDVRPKFQRGGYIHPVTTPSGRVISDDYPPNHVHHHGIWAAWTLTQFEGRKPDFWNMGDSTGTVIPVRFDAAWSGPVHAGFRSHHRYMDLSARPAKPALEEEWIVTAYNMPGSTRRYHIFDLVQTQHTSSQNPLILPEYRYGGVGFRGRREWDGETNTVFLTSEGKTRIDGHGTRARWCHIGGKVGGAWTGITVMDHPSNFRAPQPMRIHPTEPFFNYAPSQAGDWSIEPGKPLVQRYRFVVYDGEADPKDLDRIWNDYAFPPETRLSVK